MPSNLDPVTRAVMEGATSVKLNMARVAEENPHLPLTYLMLRGFWRGYVIEKIKAPIIKTLIALANRLPEPTKVNTVHHNTHVWIDVLDKFLEMEDSPRGQELFGAIRKVWLAEHEHDSYYRDRMQVILELWLDEVLKGNWKPRLANHPDQCWKANLRNESKGYEFLQQHYKGRNNERP